MCISNYSKAALIAKNCIEMYGISMMLLDAILLKANTAPNSVGQNKGLFHLRNLYSSSVGDAKELIDFT